MNLNQVTIESADVNRSVQFYLKLGLQLIVDSRPRYVRFARPDGDSTFSVSHNDQASSGTTTLYFEVDNVAKTIAQLKQQGLSEVKTPKDQRWLWLESEMEDPDGHHLKIYTAGANRKNPPWRINNKTHRMKRWFDCFIESPVNLLK